MRIRMITLYDYFMNHLDSYICASVADWHPHKIATDSQIILINELEVLKGSKSFLLGRSAIYKFFCQIFMIAS